MKMRDTPCETCGWKYPGFHVCVDPNTPIEPRILRKHVHVPGRHAAKITPERRAHLTSIVSERWERHREENAARDRDFVAAYESGLSIKETCAKFQIAFQTGRNILYRAEMRGDVEMRPRGYSARKTS